jgi:hypothetical protein
MVAMKLVGVDVGFSKTRKTTGIASLDGYSLCLTRTGTESEDRTRCIPEGFRATVAAFDGPLVPQDLEPPIRRACEFVFVHAPFDKRCKPGLSQFGTGLKLRYATTDACAQLNQFISFPSGPGTQVDRCGPIVEAFPNAFLAVLLPEVVFSGEAAQKIKRGRRFDWLYDQALKAERLDSKSLLLDLPDEVWHRLREEKNHELRASLICLLTAAFAAQGTAALIGESTGGWFWLPPYSLWEPWAKRGLMIAAEAIANKGHPRLDVL